MPLSRSEAGIEAAAQLLGCDVPAIKAVAEVESRGQGFLPNGKLKILFEGHIFFKYTHGAYAAQHPTICYPHWTRQFYLGGVREWDRMDEALTLDHDAALMSASYGKFQIMGFNFAHCGFTSVDAFVTALETGARPAIGAADGRRALVIAYAAVESARSGRVVEMEE